MGKSAKFYKRPTKKEKEAVAIKKLVEPKTITKKSSKESQKISLPASLLTQEKKKAKSPVDLDVDMTENEKPKPVKEKKEAKVELPDYVDLFSGKKTYKKIPGKRK